jgi:hypothetical protein
VLFPSTGDLPQFAVPRHLRRNGIGTRLLQTAAAIAGNPLRILNVDPSLAPFLTAIGAQRFVRQIEMERVL